MATIIIQFACRPAFVGWPRRALLNPLSWLFFFSNREPLYHDFHVATMTTKELTLSTVQLDASKSLPHKP